MYYYMSLITCTFSFTYQLQLIEQEVIELKNKFSTPRRSILEETDCGQVEDIDVIPNEEMLLVCLIVFSFMYFFFSLNPQTKASARDFRL